MRMNRRQVLRLAGAGALTVPLAAACDSGGGGSGKDSEGDSTGVLLRSEATLPERFQVPLPIPQVLGPASSDGTTDYYDITQRVSRAEILPGLRTEIWGYNGTFPGPTIRTPSGRRTVIRHRNELPVPVAVHLHGGRTPAESDGYPTDLLLPATGWDAGHGAHASHVQESTGTKEYTYPLDQPAATLWYHDHRMDFTGPQVYRGLAGFHLVTDDEEAALSLPGGDHDIPLMIADRAFAEDGAFLYPSIDPSLRGEPGVENRYMRGVLGDVILVNGAPWPVLEVSANRYRFRVLNASNARRYRLTLDPAPGEGPPFVQVGSDAGLLGEPIEHDAIEIAAAERFDLVVDFGRYRPGTEVTLRNTFGDGAAGEVMRFRVGSRGEEHGTVPARLAGFERLPDTQATVRRRVRFAREARGNGAQLWTINGAPFDPARVDIAPKLGTTEIWRITSNVHHPVHLHLVRFQVLARNGRAPGPYDAGWKDTVDLADGENVDVIAHFSGYPGKYVFHCHNLEHEDMMMMANMQVS